MALLAVGLPLAAEGKRTAIALVAGQAPRGLHAQLRAELVSLGWRIREMPLGDEVALAQVARRANTLAVVRVGRSAEGIELWVAPEVDAEARSEWVDVDPHRPELAVLRAVEALRARFLELGIEPEDSRDGTDVPPGVTSAERPPQTKPEARKPDPKADAAKAAAAAAAAKKAAANSGSDAGHDDGNLPVWNAPSDEASYSLPPLPPLQRAIWLGAGGGVSAASSTLGPSVALVGAARVVPFPGLGIGIEFWWSPSTSQIETVEGTTEVRASLAAISGEYRRRYGQFVFGAGGGIGLNMLFTQGFGAGNYIGRQAAAYTALPFVRLAGEFELSQRVHLRAEATAGLSVPRAIVTFAGREVASYGRPFIGGSLSLEAALFGD